MDYILDQLTIMRRISEARRDEAVERLDSINTDTFQHLLDEIERTRRYVLNKKEG